MSTPTLIRWSGLSLMLGGIGLAVHYITHPPGETAQYSLQPLWGFSHWLGAFASVLTLFGLFGLYARQAQRIGRLGFVGFVMAVAGGALSAGALMFGGAVIQPIIAAQAPQLLELDGPFFTSSALKVAGGLILAGQIGLLLLAIATLRARILPPIGSWIVISVVPAGVVAVLILLVKSDLLGIIQALLGTLIGAGALAWGYGLWRDPADTDGHSAGTQ